MDFTKLPFQKLKVKPILTNEQTESLLGRFLDASAVTTLIDKSTDVYCEETGACLLKFRKGVAPQEMVDRTFECLQNAAEETDNRGLAAGKMSRQEAESFVTRNYPNCFLVWPEGAQLVTRLTLRTADGHVSSVSRANRVRSGVVGFMESSPRFPYCRMTAFTQANFAKFSGSFDMIRLVDDVYRQLMPQHYALQRAQAEASNQDFIIADTAFTTVTVNKNWQTACHTDKGDFTQGFGNLVALRKGQYTGGYFTLPQYGVGVDMQNGDVLLVDVHKVHGNTPMVKKTVGATRLSLVMYFREGIEKCGAQEDELRTARAVMRKRLKL